MENKKIENTKFTMESPTITQDKFLRANSKFIAFGGAKGGGKIWAARSKAILMGLNYPGITICFVGKSSRLFEEEIALLAEKTLNGLAKYDYRRQRLEFKNGSTIVFRKCASGQTDSLAGCEFDVIFILRADIYNEVDLTAITWMCRGNNEFPKRVYYIFDFLCGYIYDVFFIGLYRENTKPEDYTLLPMIVGEGGMKRADVPSGNVIEIYGA